MGKEYRNTWTTDENAIACTENKLTGGTYKIKEIQVPNGFIELEKDCIFEINNRNNTLEYDEDFDAYITVTVGNKQAVANIEINKSIELMKNADLSLVDTSDLSGIKFKLVAKEDILDMADGSVIYEKGKEIGTYNLEVDGKLTIKNLPLGIYEIQEIETLKGLILDDTKYEIALKQEDTVTEIYNYTVNITNKTSKFEFSKTDITGDKELEGANLQVKDEENNTIDEWVSGKNSHKIEGLEIGKKYKLIETIAPNGYAKSTEIEFEVKNTKEVQKVTMIDKIVDITKTDLTNGEEIEGAELVITDEDGNIVDKWTSTNESHHVKGLEENKKYTLTEITAPYGYEIAESIDFVVSTDKETQKIEMKDMPILKSVQIEKLDKATGKNIKLNKFEFGIYENEECTKLIRKVSSDENKGIALFDKLKFGTYYIKETKAPLGYKLSNQVVKVEINDKGVFADDIEIEEKDDVYSINYYNSLQPVIQTGNETNYALLFGLLGVSLVGAITGIVVLRRSRK